MCILFYLCLDVDDEYEDEDPWEDGAEDILEKGKKLLLFEMNCECFVCYIYRTILSYYIFNVCIICSDIPCMHTFNSGRWS